MGIARERVWKKGVWSRRGNPVSHWGQPRNDYIQSIMMNYFSFNPNFSLQLQQCPQTYPARSSYPPSLILNTLSLALTNSILNYQNLPSIHTAPPIDSPAPQLPPTPLKQPSLFSTPAEPIQTETQLTVQKQNNGITEEKTDVLQITLQIEASSHPPSAKADHSSAPKPTTFVPLREQNHKKKPDQTSKVDVGKVQGNRSTAVVPTIDLIETAYLGICGWQREVWCDKRMELLVRRVDEWSEKGKNRRDKRELRLLQN